MSNITSKIKAYLRLIRIHSLPVTALTPLLGACATFTIFKGDIFHQEHLFILFSLFIVGIIIHIFGEILNDYMDVDIDRSNPELSNKPLVSGEISKKGALISIFISFIVLIFVFIFSKFHPLSILIFVIAAVTGIIYQLISKKWLHSAILLAAWAFFIILFGGVYAGKYQNLFNVPVLVYIISIMGFFHLWMNTAILGHLKDVKNDAEYGIKTFPVRFGVRVIDDGKIPKLIIPMNFRIMVIIIQIINLIVAFTPIIFYKRIYDGEINIFLLSSGLLFLSFMILGSQYKILWHTIFQRNKLMRMMAIREIGTYFLAIVLISPLISWVLLLVFIFLPLIWFIIINKIFTGNAMQPPI